MDRYNILVSCASGVESVTKRELKRLGFPDAKALNGNFRIEGNGLDVGRLNMFLRTAERVYIEIGSFYCDSFDSLFENVKMLEWENYLDNDGMFAVNGKTVKSKLFALSSIQSVVKKAILERLSEKGKIRVFPESGARFFIDFYIREDFCTMSINTSGEGLHKRGYRDYVGEAPLRETLASTLLYLSNFQYDRAFIDPFCGSGTIPIEAARMALNIASGRDREFDFAKWKKFDTNVYNLIKKEALDTEILDKKLRFSGFDIDKNAIKLSMRHAKQAGVEGKIHFQVRDVAMLSSSYSGGCIVTNPPYGERLSDINGVNKLNKTLGEVCRNLNNWSVFVITSALQFEKYFGQKSDKNRKFFSADKERHFYMFYSK